jgi:hypothetical protein
MIILLNHNIKMTYFIPHHFIIMYHVIKDIMFSRLFPFFNNHSEFLIVFESFAITLLNLYLFNFLK